MSRRKLARLRRKYNAFRRVNRGWLAPRFDVQLERCASDLRLLWQLVN